MSGRIRRVIDSVFLVPLAGAGPVEGRQFIDRHADVDLLFELAWD